MRKRVVTILTIAMAFVGWSSQRLWAVEFFQGKTLTILVGFTPGGGYDINARLLSRHIGRHIAGNPAVIVQNMPGAASMTAVKYLDLTAPKDGTVIGTFTFAQIGDSRMRPERVKMDFRKFSWIGSSGVDPPFCYVWHTLGVNSLTELRAHGRVHMGMTAPGAADDVGERILRNIFAVDVQQVAGYPGSVEAGLAMERGESDGGCGNWSTVSPDWIAARRVAPILNLGSFRPAGMSQSVPFAADMAASDRHRSLLRVLIGSAEVGRPFIASASVPPERIRLLREAFNATMRDPEFLADAEKLRVPIAPKTGEEALKVVADIYATPDDIVADARKIMDE